MNGDYKLKGVKGVKGVNVGSERKCKRKAGEGASFSPLLLERGVERVFARAAAGVNIAGRSKCSGKEITEFLRYRSPQIYKMQYGLAAQETERNALSDENETLKTVLTIKQNTFKLFL
ncbi:MAG: hypothetical protein LUB59_06145 [Candidatus Gastranaerophilales bacterium]|nr:hypothetical protein [Candidatus Gastranaerophilales bacterium]